MSVTATAVEPLTGHRERKKERTRRDLANAARRLTAEHGLEAVTIQQIAEAADVSTRTFFNYFSCKEEAIVGVDPGGVRELADAVIARPASEPPIVALMQTMIDNAATPEVAEGWVQRTELVARHAALLPRHLAAMAEVEQALAVAIATRMGASVEDDPLPTFMVVSAVSVLRAAFAWWMDSDRTEPLPTVLAGGYAALAAGFSAPITTSQDTP